MVEAYFKETSKAEDKRRPISPNRAIWISFCLVTLGYALMLPLRLIPFLLGAVSVMSGLSLLAFAAFLEGKDLQQIYASIPAAHIQASRSKAALTMELYNEFNVLDTDALKILCADIKTQKEYTHNINKLMLGDLGFVPTTLLGISGALTLKTLFALHTTWISVAIIFVIALSFLGFYVRLSVERYQEVIAILQSVIDAKMH